MCNIVHFVDQHLADDLKDPRSCLLQQCDWPEQTPQAKVYASDSEWYKLCSAAAEMKLFAPVATDKLFHNQFGVPVLNGCMAVDKLKTIDGQAVRQQDGGRQRGAASSQPAISTHPSRG